jgi:beta-lactamase regulating signal transducer with metallopeptidase domain
VIALASNVAPLLLERLVLASLELAFLAVVFRSAMCLLRIRSPRMQSLLWLLVLAKPIVTITFGAIFPVATMSALPFTGSPQAVEYEFAVQGDGPLPLTGASSDGEQSRHLRGATLPGAAGSLSALWLLGIAIGAALSVVGRVRVRRLLARARIADHDAIRLYERLGTAMKLRHLPPLLVSDELESPALVGTFRPCVVLPAWIVSEGRRATLVWSLRHELTHFALRDPWAAWVVRASRTLLFFHPCAWWAGRLWHDATERACDGAVARTRRAAVAYADELYRVISKVRDRRRVALAGSLFATRTQIGRRIESLLRNPQSGHTGKVALLTFAALAVATLSIGTEFAVEHAADRDIEVREADGTRTVSYTETLDDGRRRRFRMDGDVELSTDQTVVRLGARARVVVSETHGDVSREIVITPDKDGLPVYRYTVNGEQRELDADAREWMTDLIRTSLEHTNRNRRSYI